ncbi:hypothetical protein [Roseateles depolymerans]|uniref:Uncharacterized protein n=1 Tax=Roseateles depolymerans TaxID=76731 RepID=A0A0U3LGJ3_9BURK|nr:hypothetical protein [Roseateles depolymerans]ALV05602.1 hypothetical protein RD2015_1109 [Roseateles depolymerans]REG14377.1 hypothetical protein DES44_2870 [Roseateles depolymerans]
MAKSFVVNSEERAWRLLKNWVETDQMPEVEFEGWPKLQIAVEGDEYHSSLNSSQMAALVDFKKTIGRTYAMISHGAYDMRRLHQDEEEQLDFNTQVKQGSSLLETDLSPLVQALSSTISTHPAASLAVGLILGLAFVARPVILKHYEHRAKQLDVDERARLLNLGLSSREKEQFDLYEQSLKKVAKTHPQIHQALPDARHAFWKFASASANADRMTVAGIDLSGDDLEILSERRKRRVVGVEEITKDFKVLGIDKAQGAYRIKLETAAMAVTATFRRPQVTDAKVRQLFRCMADGQIVSATLEVKTADKAQLSARLLKFKVKQPDQSADEVA